MSILQVVGTSACQFQKRLAFIAVDPDEPLRRQHQVAFDAQGLVRQAVRFVPHDGRLRWLAISFTFVRQTTPHSLVVGVPRLTSRNALCKSMAIGSFPRRLQRFQQLRFRDAGFNQALAANWAIGSVFFEASSVALSSSAPFIRHRLPRSRHRLPPFRRRSRTSAGRLRPATCGSCGPRSRTAGR